MTTNEHQLVLHGKDGHFTYILDNLRLRAGEQFSYSYELMYRPVAPQRISLEDIPGADYQLSFAKDGLLDIKMQPQDGCLRKMKMWVNAHKNQNRTYAFYHVNLQDYVDSTVKDIQAFTDQNTQTFLSGITNMDDLEGVVNERPLMKSLLSLIGEAWKKDQLFTIDLNLFEEQLQGVEETLSKVAEGLCNGYRFGSSPCK